MVQQLKAAGIPQNVYTLKDDVHIHNHNNNCTGTTNGGVVYVAGQTFARGLDIPNLTQVLLVSPPTSAAAYAQLAGRTGRAGQSGQCITFLQTLTEAQRLVSISQSLHLSFADSNQTTSIPTASTTHDSNKYQTNAIDPENDDTTSTISKDALQSLTVVQLDDELRRYGLPVSGKKDQLIQRLLP